MRLSVSEISIIKKVISQFGLDLQLFLHGSRLDDSLKGGDIDLFLIVPDEIEHSLKQRKHYIEAALSRDLREQQIDLTVLGQSQSQHDHFFQASDKTKL